MRTAQGSTSLRSACKDERPPPSVDRFQVMWITCLIRPCSFQSPFSSPITCTFLYYPSGLKYLGFTCFILCHGGHCLTSCFTLRCLIAISLRLVSLLSKWRNRPKKHKQHQTNNPMVLCLHSSKFTNTLTTSTSISLPEALTRTMS